MLLKPLEKSTVKDNIQDFVHLIKDWKYGTWQAENFLYDLPKKWDFSFAAYNEKKELAGFCFASNKIEDVYYIHLIFIASTRRGLSLGNKMIEYAKKYASKNNINSIELRCPESNESALKFYTKLGFKIKDKLQDEISGSEADYYLRLDF